MTRYVSFLGLECQVVSKISLTKVMVCSVYQYHMLQVFSSRRGHLDYLKPQHPMCDLERASQFETWIVAWLALS